jgi:hypothetical protein
VANDVDQVVGVLGLGAVAERESPGVTRAPRLEREVLHRRCQILGGRCRHQEVDRHLQLAESPALDGLIAVVVGVGLESLIAKSTADLA